MVPISVIVAAVVITRCQAIGEQADRRRTEDSTLWGHHLLRPAILIVNRGAVAEGGADDED